MNQQEATDFVIQELGKHHQENDVIQKLCEATNMNWSQAEKFVHQVVAQHGGQIARKQGPLVALIGTGIFILGAGITLVMIVATFQGRIYSLRIFPFPYSGNIAYIVIGITIAAGGVRGMWDTITRMWNG